MVRNLTLDARFCLIGCSEVNSIRYSPPNKPINAHEKHYSIVSYIPKKIKKKKLMATFSRNSCRQKNISFLSK